MKYPRFPNDRTQCEKCDKATTCKKLQPCSDYAPALNTNFNARVEIENETKYLSMEMVA